MSRRDDLLRHRVGSFKGRKGRINYDNTRYDHTHWERWFSNFYVPLFDILYAVGTEIHSGRTGSAEAVH